MKSIFLESLFFFCRNVARALYIQIIKKKKLTIQSFKVFSIESIFDLLYVFRSFSGCISKPNSKLWRKCFGQTFSIITFLVPLFSPEFKCLRLYGFSALIRYTHRDQPLAHFFSCLGTFRWSKKKKEHRHTITCTSQYWI